MTNKEMFIKAHKIARETVEVVGNYSIAFKLALKQVWAVAKAEKKEISDHKMAELGNSIIYGARSQGYRSESLNVPIAERRAAQDIFGPYWYHDELTEGQYLYAAWCYLIGQKLVDSWLKVMW